MSGFWLVAIGGWIWGSFLNQLVDRLPPAREGAVPVSIWSPARSVCLGCGRGIPARDNIPVLSYLLLRGRCRSCGAAIGLRTLVVETVTPAGALVIYLLFGLAAPVWPAWALGSWALVLTARAAERRPFPRYGGVISALLVTWLAGALVFAPAGS